MSESGERASFDPERRIHDPVADLEEASDLAGIAGTPTELGQLVARAHEWSSEQAFEALGRVGQAISSSLDSRLVVREILDLAVATVGAERGLLWVGKGDLGEMVPAVSRRVPVEELGDLERISRTIVSRGRGGVELVSVDALQDPRLHDIASVRQNQVRSIVCLPLVVRGERVGVLYLDHRDANAFSFHTRTFLATFVNLAAVALENARLHDEMRRENARIREQVGPHQSFGRIVTASPAMRDVIRLAGMVARADSPVLLLGESGTGKELLARALHEASPRALQPFLAFNCAAAPRELVESLFFGHVRGAFTGATRDAAGLFAQADGGVLLLDEIADLDVALQAKLLRVLQEGIIRPLGAEREFKVDVRVITATSQDLAEAVRRGRFREDLYYRLNVLELRLPPLRKRPEDVPLLVEHFAAKHAGRAGRQPPPRFTDAAIAYLGTLPWRGNVRELENLLQRVLVLCDAPRVTADHVRALRPSSPLEGEGARPPSQTPTPRSDPPATIAEQERAAIVRALERTAGNKTRAALLLGVHRNSLVRRMQRLEIRWDT